MTSMREGISTFLDYGSCSHDSEQSREDEENKAERDEAHEEDPISIEWHHRRPHSIPLSRSSSTDRTPSLAAKHPSFRPSAAAFFIFSHPQAIPTSNSFVASDMGESIGKFAERKAKREWMEGGAAEEAGKR